MSELLRLFNIYVVVPFYKLTADSTFVWLTVFVFIEEKNRDLIFDYRQNKTFTTSR